MIAENMELCHVRQMRFIFLVLSIFLLATPAFAQVRVVDGDTLVLNEITYRLDGIDAPEAGQKCKTPTGKDWSCGTAATKEMARLTTDAVIECEALSQDGYGRTIAVCTADGVDLGATLVRTGFGWAFVKYSDRYVAEEQLARSESIGIWKALSQTAWDYRSAKWDFAAQEAPEGCPIKGNISKNGRIYHPPWSPWYSRTKISVEKGERWFCSEAEAIEAGWRAPHWH